jgi:hypothetical protein
MRRRRMRMRRRRRRRTKKCAKERRFTEEKIKEYYWQRKPFLREGSWS